MFSVLGMLRCSWGRVAWGCRISGPAGPEERAVLGAMRGVKLSAAAAAASLFPSSLEDGRAGCWSSGALALSSHLWFVRPVESSCPSPAICCICARNDFGSLSWKVAKLNSERPWVSSFWSPRISLSRASLLSPIIAFWIPVELLYTGFHGQE